MFLSKPPFTEDFHGFSTAVFDDQMVVLTSLVLPNDRPSGISIFVGDRRVLVKKPDDEHFEALIFGWG